MIMKNVFHKVSISPIEDLNSFIQNRIIENPDFMGATKHFRGQADIKYALQTRIASEYKDSFTVQTKANQIFNSFRNKIRAANLMSELFIADMNQGIYEKVYYLVFQAQHLGIPTPFMDWSFDWRNALYFAIENESLIDTTGQLWVMLRPFAQEENVFSLNPYFLEESVLINPSYDADAKLEKFLGEKRRSNQGGEFYILPYSNCIEPLETNTALGKSSLLLIEILPALKHQVFELKQKLIDTDLIKLMGKLRLDFRRYDNQSIYGNMSEELRSVVSSVRQEFGFSAL